LGYAEYSGGRATPGTYASTPSRLELWRPTVPLPGQVIQSLFYTADAASGSISLSSTPNLVRASFSGNVQQAATNTVAFKRGVVTLSSAAQANPNTGATQALMAAVLLDMPQTISSTSYSMTNTAAIGSRTIVLEEVMA
jgi:hypothetical protein